MSVLGTTLAQSLAGLSQAERQVPKEKRRPVSETDPHTQPEVVVDLESAEAIRSLANSRDEDSRQDHRRHQAYGVPERDDKAPPAIDVQA